MAEIFLSSFLPMLLDKLVELAAPEVIKFLSREGVHTTIHKWTEKLETIRDVLVDAEEKQITTASVKRWLDKLEDLAYDVDDMLDEFAAEALHQKQLVLEPESIKSKVRSLIPACCSSFSPSAVGFKRRIRSKIEEINGRLEDILERTTILRLKKVTGETSPKTSQKRISTSLVKKSSIYGRDEDKEKIIKLLLDDEATNDKYRVIPIVGMGGVGKTTLAQLVYNHERVQQYFDLKSWVCVSDDFDVKRIMKTILESVSPTTSVSKDKNIVQTKLKEALNKKKFLVVLDDVWNKKPTDWDDLRIPFEAGEKQSRIIVTTRDIEVALRIESKQNYYCYLNKLSDGDCWSVFKQYAFEGRNISEHQSLELIGKKIVEKCDGLPLAARTLGGILCSKLEENEWEKILDSEIWDLQENESDILPALRLSYHHLPPHLKHCFAYCSILPKDYEFAEEEIVFLWMAEGFLQQQREKQMEDLGHEYFRNLLSMSFFQQSTRNKSLFIMHDLINDLAQWVAGEKCFTLADNLEGKKQRKISKRARHSSYIGSEYDGIKKFKVFDEVEQLRTFLPLNPPTFQGYYLTNNVPFVLLPKLRCLRVLSLHRYKIEELPNSIGDLKHLRFLDLSFTLIKRLPESISTLYNLQTLILNGCYKLEKLPAKLSNIVNLRHLDISGVCLLKEMPLGMDKLKNLQTLTQFVVGEGRGSRIRELGNLLLLRGTLCISNLKNVTDALDAREAHLNDKHALNVLEMAWSQQFNGSRNGSVEEKLADKLQPPEKLKELSIKCYGGTRLPTWIGDPIALSHLVSLRLEDCINCTSLPALGQLPLLKHLSIEGMSGVNTVGPEFSGIGCPKPFPSLETLEFENMQEWENWVHCEVDGQVEIFPCLREIWIKSCPKLLGKLPDHLPSLEEVIISECQQLAVSISRVPKLCKLEIKRCQEVVLHRSTDGLSSLKSISLIHISKPLTRLMATEVEILEMSGFNEVTSLWGKEEGLLQDLTFLRHLEIRDFPKLVSLVGEVVEEEEEEQQQQELPCSRLESLKLYSCENLEKLQGFHQLTSLREFTICDCPRLVSFAETALPSMLRNLRIMRCSALKSLHLGMLQYPEFVSSVEEVEWQQKLLGAPCKLEYLQLSECNNLEEIRGLPSIIKLQINNCNALKSLIQEMMHCRDYACLLEDLHISRCDSLTYLPSSRGELPATLKHLSVTNCPELELVAERLHSNASIETIEIWSCRSLKSLPESLHSLTHLSYIYIEDCPSLVSFPDGGLPTTSLRRLHIRNCDKLAALPDRMHNHSSLQQLTIIECSGIVSFPEEGFPTNLTVLEIGNLKICKPLFDWGLHRLTSLQQLHIEGPYPDLVFFPEKDKRIILPTSLTTLAIGDFPNLEYLSFNALQNPTSLEYLWIFNCPKLKSFPKEGLPLSLLYLSIESCPLLKGRCKKDGRDWHKIAHIPYVEIDERFIYDSEEE